jgi:signal transduction histidine kinase/FixJ family two-component response regulator
VPFEHFNPRLAVSTVLAAAVLSTLLGVGALREALDRHVTWPLELRFAAAVGHAPRLSPRLKIFAFDDSAHASLRRSTLRAEQWATIMLKLARSRPGGIYTPHVFDDSDLAEGGALDAALTELSRARIPVFAAAFPYPASITAREPIPLEHVDFAPEIAPPSKAYLGWNLYGPPPAALGRFAGIGHTVFDADGRLRAFLALREDRLVPHLSLAGLGTVTPPLRLPLDAEGRARLAPIPAEVLGNATRSVHELLREPDVPSKLLEVGDVVLILPDMDAGRIRFVSTALGAMPSGYVIAAAISAAISGSYPAPLPYGLPLMALTASALALLGVLTTGYLLAAVTAVASTSLVCGALLLHAYTGSYVPWLPALLAGLAGAGFAGAWRAATRFEGQRARKARSEREKAKLSAIVRTAQMFAHDVRKPFSMLKMAVEAVQREDDPVKSHALFARLFPELTRAMAAVEGMIQDIMEIDAEASLTPEDIAIEQLLEQTLDDVFLIRQDAQVTLSYEFRHTLDVAVDRGKIRRALVNIVDNAVRAMQGHGHIWFRTHDVIESERAFIELTIGNDGLPMPPEVRERVFEAFFTVGRPNGSGLGLAIAHKAVTAHGGRIACTSSNEHGTEFVLTLPAAHVTPREHDAHGLPGSTASLAGPSAARTPRTEPPAPDEKALRAEAEAAIDALGRPLPVLIVDDEAFYRDALAATLEALVPGGKVRIRGAADAAAALSTWHDMHPALVLCDVDLGPTSANGFEVVAQIKASMAPPSLVVIHSNRVLPADARTSEAAGADAFLSKPAPKARLLELLRDAARLRLDAGKPPVAGGDRPLVAVVDDSPFTLEAWKLCVKDADIVTFECPAEFWSAALADASLLARLSCLVTDYYFDNESAIDGIDFARAVKEKRADLPVYLSSNAELDDLPAHALDGRIGKEPVHYAEIAAKARKLV